MSKLLSESLLPWELTQFKVTLLIERLLNPSPQPAETVICDGFHQIECCNAVINFFF